MSVLADFERMSGGRPKTSFGYSGAGVRKHSLFWDFFKTHPEFNNSITVYSGSFGLTVGEMLESNSEHSIEHVVPKSILKTELKDPSGTALQVPVSQHFINGSEMNPLNWLPAQRDINSRRGILDFDYDGHSITPRESRRLVDVNGLAMQFEGGRDSDGPNAEWVVPMVSRGDIARIVLYMVVVYKLKFYVDVDEILVLRKWASADKPSKFEKMFQKWMLTQDVVDTLGGSFQNPFINGWNYFGKNLSVFSLLIYESTGLEITKDIVDEPAVTEFPVVIESVHANPRGYDEPGKEWVSLRNTGSKISFSSLVLKVETGSQGETEYELNQVSFQERESIKLYFDESNALPNKPRTTLRLFVDGKEMHPVSYRRAPAGQEATLKRKRNN